MAKANYLYLITHDSTVTQFVSSFARRNPDGSYDVQPPALAHALQKPYNDVAVKAADRKDFTLLMTKDVNGADNKQNAVFSAMRSYSRDTGTSDKDIKKRHIYVNTQNLGLSPEALVYVGDDKLDKPDTAYWAEISLG